MFDPTLLLLASKNKSEKFWFSFPLVLLVANYNMFERKCRCKVEHKTKTPGKCEALLQVELNK